MGEVLFEMHVFYSQSVEFKGLVVVKRGAGSQPFHMKMVPGLGYYISMIRA